MSRRHGRSRLRSPWRPGAWLQRHLQVFFASLGRLWRRPLGNAMSILVIAIAMALPAGLHLLVLNLERLAGNWQGGASATLFLRQGIGEEAVAALVRELRADPRTGRLEHRTPEQALEEFRHHSGLGEAVALLEENPLPHVLLLRPADPQIASDAFAAWLEALGSRPEVERALADLEWVRRFQALLAVAERGTRILSALLALAVLLVIGNTIRLEIQSRRQEIEIIKLVGGSHAFIRRPFLYEGFWYGLLGGLLALLLVILSLRLLAGPVESLARLYGSAFALQGPDGFTVLAVLGAGVVLGVVGAWLAVQRQLDEIEPV